MINIKTLASSSKGNAYLVTDGRTQILLEAGISFKEIKKKLKFKTHGIKGCLVSHEHKDHSKAVNEVLKVGIDVYTSKGTAESIQAEGHRVNVVKAKKQFKIGTWIILPFEVQHDASEPLGFLMVNEEGEKLLFATDTYYIKYKFKGLTHIMIECNYSKNIVRENIEDNILDVGLKNRLIKSHFSLENVKEFLKANDLSKVEEIHLIHLSDKNSDGDLFKREIEALTGKLVIVGG